MRGGAGGIVRIEHALIGRSPINAVGDGRRDAVAGHVGKFLIHELGRVGLAFAHEAGVEPLLGDALELAEKVELRLLAGVAPFCVEQLLGRRGRARGWPHVV